MLIILQPAFFLLTIYNELKTVEMGDAVGTVFTGLCLGLMFLKLCKNLNPDFSSAEGSIFLLSPPVLFLLASITSGSNFIWITFLFIYLISGAVLFIKNNPNGLNKTELYVISLCVPFLILSLMINFVTRGIAYSPDSYGYYNMSRKIFSDFGYVSVIRQYVEFTDYGISFPYLFPMIVAIFNHFTGFGMLSGTCINIIAALVSLYYILKISSKLTTSVIPGLIVSVVFVLNSDYLGEMISARAVPLSMLCALLIINIIPCSEMPNRKELFLAGLFAGAGMVIRFDFIVISGLLGVILLFIYKKNIFKFVPFYCLGLLVFTAPWILYSLAHFNKLWISDNNGTLFLITPLLPQRFFTPDEVVPDIFSNPGAWIISRQNIIIRGLAGFFSIITRPVELIMLLGIAGTGILSRSKFPNNRKNYEKPVKSFRLLFIFTILIYIMKTMAIIMVGYGDLRYHTEALIIVSLIILCAIYGSLANHKVWIYFTILIFSISVMNNMQPAFKDTIQPKLLNAFINTEIITPDSETKEIEKILMEDGGFPDNGEIRLFYVDSDPYRPYSLGAYTGIKAYARITNINEERLLYLVKNYIDPNYIYLPEGEKKWLHILREHYLINIISEKPPLYNIAALKELDDNFIRLSSISDANWNNGVDQKSSTMLFRNTVVHRMKLENAVGFEINGIYAEIENISEFSDDWIYVKFKSDIDLAPFAYPNEIKILK